jgi:hypothetical protein
VSSAYRNVGTLKAASNPKFIETLDECSGDCRAKQCCMQSVPDNDALNQVERLAAELRAIEHWDFDYWLRAVPERSETLAFVARRKRSTEIISQLLTLIPGLEIKGQECLWIVRKSSRRKKQKSRGTYFRL